MEVGVFRFLRHQEVAAEAQTDICEVASKARTQMMGRKHRVNNHMHNK